MSEEINKTDKELPEILPVLDNYLTETIISLGELRDALYKNNLNKAGDRIGKVYDILSESNTEYEKIRESLLELL